MIYSSNTPRRYYARRSTQIFLAGLLIFISFSSNVHGWSPLVKSLAYKVANGTATAGETARLFMHNGTLNEMALLGPDKGGIDYATYAKCQTIYDIKAQSIVAEAVAENGATSTIQIRTGTGFQPTTDLDIITDATSPEQIRAIQKAVNKKIHEYVHPDSKTSPNNYCKSLDIDVMLDPDGVTPEQFDATSRINNDAYSEKGSATHEKNIRERAEATKAGKPPPPIDVKNALTHAREMLKFQTKKQATAKAVLNEIIKLKNNPATRRPGTRAYKMLKSLEATHQKLIHQQMKYSSRFNADMAEIARAEGLTPPESSSIPGEGAKRVTFDPDGNPIAPVKPAKAYTGNALSKHLLDQQLKNHAKLLTDLAKKNPEYLPQAAAAAKNLSFSEQGALIEEIRLNHGDQTAKNLAEQMNKKPGPSRLLPPLPSGGGIFGDGSFTVISGKGNTFRLTSTQLGPMGTALTAGGMVLMVLDTGEVVKGAAIKAGSGDVAGAALDTGLYAGMLYGGFKLGHGLAWAFPNAVPVLGAGMVAYGLTTKFLNNTTVGQALSDLLYEETKGRTTDMVTKWDDLDIDGTNAAAKKREDFIKLIKSGKFQPKTGMSVAEAWNEYLNTGSLKTALEPRPDPTELLEIKDAADLQGAWETAWLDGKIDKDDPDAYDKFKREYYGLEPLPVIKIPKKVRVEEDENGEATEKDEGKEDEKKDEVTKKEEEPEPGSYIFEDGQGGFIEITEGGNPEGSEARVLKLTKQADELEKEIAELEKLKKDPTTILSPEAKRKLKLLKNELAANKREREIERQKIEGRYVPPKRDLTQPESISPPSTAAEESDSADSDDPDAPPEGFNSWDDFVNDSRSCWSENDDGTVEPGLMLPQPRIGEETKIVNYPGNPELDREISFFNGEPHGIWSSYRPEDGGLSKRRRYVMGKLMRHISYYPGRRLRFDKTFTYTDGVSYIMTTIWYDEYGKITSRETDERPLIIIPHEKLPELPDKCVPIDEVESYRDRLEKKPEPPPVDDLPTVEEELAEQEDGTHKDERPDQKTPGKDEQAPESPEVPTTGPGTSPEIAEEAVEPLAVVPGPDKVMVDGDRIFDSPGGQDNEEGRTHSDTRSTTAKEPDLKSAGEPGQIEDTGFPPLDDDRARTAAELHFEDLLSKGLVTEEDRPGWSSPGSDFETAVDRQDDFKTEMDRPADFKAAVDRQEDFKTKMDRHDDFKTAADRQKPGQEDQTSVSTPGERAVTETSPDTVTPAIVTSETDAGENKETTTSQEDYYRKLRDKLDQKKQPTAVDDSPKRTYYQELQDALNAKQESAAPRPPGEDESKASYHQKLAAALSEKKSVPELTPRVTTPRHPSKPRDTRTQTSVKRQSLVGVYRGTTTTRMVIHDAKMAAAFREHGQSTSSTSTDSFTAKVTANENGFITFSAPDGTPMRVKLNGNSFQIREATGDAVFTGSGSIVNGRLSGKGESRDKGGKMSIYITFNGTKSP